MVQPKNILRIEPASPAPPHLPPGNDEAHARNGGVTNGTDKTAPTALLRTAKNTTGNPRVKEKDAAHSAPLSHRTIP